MRKAQNLENKDKGISVEVFCGVFCYGFAVGKVSRAMLFENPAEVEGNHAQLSMKSKTRADDISFNRRHLIKTGSIRLRGTVDDYKNLGKLFHRLKTAIRPSCASAIA